MITRKLQSQRRHRRHTEQTESAGTTENVKSFQKNLVENADLYKLVLKKTITTHKKCVKYNFVTPFKDTHNLQHCSSQNISFAISFDSYKLYIFERENKFHF